MGLSTRLSVKNGKMSMNGRVKAYELRSRNKEELLGQLKDLKTELGQLRVAKVTAGAASKLAKIKVVRKSIARVLTVMKQAQRESLRAFYKGKKFIPIDLRVKKTRAIRRQMTKFEQTRVTNGKAHKAIHFPQRKF